MKKTIGATFSQELETAGLSGLPFAWGEDGEISFGEEMTNEQKAAVMAVYERHDPTTATAPESPLDKLKNFLAVNPDVAALLK